MSIQPAFFVTGLGEKYLFENNLSLEDVKKFNEFESRNGLESLEQYVDDERYTMLLIFAYCKNTDTISRAEKLVDNLENSYKGHAEYVISMGYTVFLIKVKQDKNNNGSENMISIADTYDKAALEHLNKSIFEHGYTKVVPDRFIYKVKKNEDDQDPDPSLRHSRPGWDTATKDQIEKIKTWNWNTKAHVIRWFKARYTGPMTRKEIRNEIFLPYLKELNSVYWSFPSGSREEELFIDVVVSLIKIMGVFFLEDEEGYDEFVKLNENYWDRDEFIPSQHFLHYHYEKLAVLSKKPEQKKNFEKYLEFLATHTKHCSDQQTERFTEVFKAIHDKAMKNKQKKKQDRKRFFFF